jgi:hypothetical protein
VQGTDDDEEEQTQEQQNETQEDEPSGPSCGDNVCAESEDWKSCTQDCSKPQQVSDAEEAITDAENTINEGEDGYQLLEDARAKFEAGEYDEAKQLAQQAVQKHDAAEEQTGGMNYLQNKYVFAIVALVLIIAAVLYAGRERISEMAENAGMNVGNMLKCGSSRSEYGGYDYDY